MIGVNVALATIANGASQSSVIDLEDFAYVAIVFPAAFTGTSVTFLASDSPTGTFVPVYDSAGTEVTVTAGTARTVALTGADFEGLSALRYIKVRSGTAAAPTAEAAERALKLILKRC